MAISAGRVRVPLRRLLSLTTFFLVLASVGILAPRLTHAQAASRPLHSHLNAFGDGWQCDRGYGEAEGLCIPIRVPPHAYLDAMGDEWECNHGYRRQGGSCVEIDVPPHAHLADISLGQGWDCD